MRAARHGARSHRRGRAAGADFALITGDLLAHRFLDNVENALGFAQGSRHHRGKFAVKTTLFVAEQAARRIAGQAG